MTDYSELKNLATAASPGPWLQENDDLYFKDDGYTRHMMTTDSGHDVCDDEDCDDAHRENLKYIAAANPAVVLALIAENYKLKADLREAKDAKLGLNWAIGEIKAENEKLLARDKMHIEHFNGLSEFRDRTVEGFDSKIAALEAEIEALRVDAGRYRYLRTKSIPLDGHDFLSSMEILDYRVDVAIRNKP